MMGKSNNKEENKIYIPEPKYQSIYPPFTCGCGCFNQPKEREDCYFYHEERHMGGTILTCNYHEKLGYCPCESCGKYVSRSEVSKRVFQAVKDYVNKRENDSSEVQVCDKARSTMSKTNFETIKEMDINELAEFLCRKSDCSEHRCHMYHECENGDKKKWLEREVGE